MKKDSTHLALVVDRSGSMIAIAEDAEGGLKRFIAEQRAVPGELTIEMFQFDTQYEKVTDIDTWTLVPRGMTALLDAIGKAIVEVGEGLAARPEEERPAKVIFMIVTDGLENSSREWTRKQVFDAITRQRDEWKWEFVFAAANQDAIAEGASMGIASNMNYTPSAAGTHALYATASASVSDYRTGNTQKVEVPENAPEE